VSSSRIDRTRVLTSLGSSLAHGRFRAAQVSPGSVVAPPPSSSSSSLALPSQAISLSVLSGGDATISPDDRGSVVPFDFTPSSIQVSGY
jgi:hypothetical protein